MKESWGGGRCEGLGFGDARVRTLHIDRVRHEVEPFT